MATLSQLKQQYTYKTGVSSLLTENQRQTITTDLQEEEEARRNQGGFFGGIGYAFEKLGLGFLSSIEGIWDYTAGGLAKLFGADEWAEQQFANDWVNYNHADEWFNPSEGWQFVGDVAGGIGTSLPAIATVVAAGAIAVASGGTLSPVAAALISGAVAGLGAAGNATKQAYRETGELGGKEFGYGALVGITEGAVEGLSAGIGAGTGQIVKGISKSFGKEVAETVTRQTIGKAMIKGFIGEAFEEGLSEILDPVWARLTYDPNAKNATLQEVGYAALVGGLSGAIMGGVDVSIRNVHSMSRGNTIVKEGKSSNVISMAEQLSTYEGENHTGYEQFEMVNSTLKELQTSMQKTNGEIRTAKQRMLLGVLEQANTTAAFTPFIARSAENIVNNADVIAEKLTAYGIKDAQGNPVTFTAEQIRSGVDTKNTSTFVNALKTNSVLRALAVADATGRLSMDTAKFKDATLRGQQLSTQADLNQFIENATDVERQAVGERLSISDWNTLTNEQFQQKIVEFSQNGGVEAYQQEQATVRELQNIDPATAKKMPARLNLKKDGTVRYTNGAVNIAVTKNGDTYRIYDYDSGKYSKPLTQAEANRTIREIKKAQAAAGAEIYAPARLERVDGVFVNKDGRRYALKGDRTPVDGMSRGQRAKFAANNTRPKVYSKIDATEIINSIIDERLVFDDKYGSLSGKSRAQVIDTLFTKLNNTSEGYRIGVALDIADYIINNAVLTDMYDSYDDVSYAMETLSVIRRYMHKVDLRGIKGEIQHKFDKKNAVSLVWGAKQGGMAPDVIAQELQSYGINIEAINEADQFFEMLEIYEKAKSDVSKKAEKVSLTAYGSKTQIEKLRQQIARDILTAYDEKGTQSKYGKLVEKYTNQIESLTKQVRQARKINSVVNSLVDSAQYLRDIAAKRNYVGAEVFSAPELTSWLKNLGKLKYRSDLRKSGARKILLDYGKFYNTNNPLLYDADPNLTYIDNNVLDALNFLQQNADSTKPLSLEELQAAQVIMASAKHLFQNYDQMTMEGKKVRISEAATAGNAIIQRTKSRVGRGFFNSIYGVFNKIVEPRVVIKSFENYDPNGILTRAYNEITRGETAASLQYIQLVEKFDDYFKTNKKYRKRLTSEYITVAGAELNVGQALSLYELSKREQAKAGLYEAGFSYIDKKGKKQTVSITESDIDALQSAFTESDKQFISIVEEFFNVQSKKVKTDADLQILGYTNASDDFYFPIQRDKGTIAKNITDARDLMADWANVYNFSFNKDVKTGAKNKIFVPEIWSVITRHAKQLSTYAHLTVPLKNFSQIYAKNIGDKTHVQSIRNTLNEQVWGGADAYLSKLFADIQGKATSSSVIEKLRGAYAKYQLGANLKVIVSQLTSYPTAGIELDFRSMVKGAVMKTDYAAMDKYCDYARVRNYEKGVVRAEGVIDKVGKVGDIFTKPIQWTDRAAIGKIWNACQVQIERNDGHKIGTVENMQAAGVLLEEVIRLTQPNYTNTERSALMRSDSDIVRSFTMFTSVPLKQLSRLVESVGEYKTLRQMIKSGDTNADIQSRYKKAKKRLGKTLASITVANLMYTMVAQFFKWLYAKDRKDKDGNEISFVQDFFTDFASTTIGMFPVVKDIYNYFANDYEFSNFAYDSINSILSTTKDLFEVATKAAGGESLETSDYMKPLRNSLYAIGQITGLPIRNINNTISGVIKRFSPATAYKYNSMFYNAQYSKDIKAALANGDTELADTIMSLMLDEDKAGNLSAGARKKLIELYEQEYEVLPRSIGDSVTYNGEKIELTAKQREKFKRVYGKANGYIERMVQNKSFAKLSANKQAKAIKQVYDAYYDKALAETLGVSSNNKLLLLSKFMGIESLSIALAGISDITSDKDKNGATVQGSKKKKVIQYLLGLNFTDAQRLLILFMQGYKIGDGEYKRLTADRAKRMVISYILSLNKATQAEKAQLAQMCGVEVKNGRIVTKSLYAAK